MHPFPSGHRAHQDRYEDYNDAESIPDENDHNYMDFSDKSDIPLRIPHEHENNEIMETSLGIEGTQAPLQLNELEKLFEMFH